MKLVGRTFLVIFLSFLSLKATAQTRRALVIGLGKQEDKQWCDINGDKDVRLVKPMLELCGFKDIMTLSNEGAKYIDIVNAFKELTRKCKKGDIIYIHFSGHGQLVTDVNQDEKDPFDESWIPYDAYLKPGILEPYGQKHLIDDMVNVLLNGIVDRIGSNGKMLVVVDACHSGDSTRGDDYEDEDENIGPVRGVGEKYEFEPNPEFVRNAFNEFKIPYSRKKAQQGKERWITISACDEFQSNYEIIIPKEGQVGKLTYTLYSLVTEGRVVDEKSIKSVMSIYSKKTPQTPVVSGMTKYKISDILKKK